MCAQTRPQFILSRLSSQRVFGEWSQNLRPREKSPLPKIILPRGGSNPQRCIKQDSEPNTLPTSYNGLKNDLNTANKPTFRGRLTECSRGVKLHHTVGVKINHPADMGFPQDKKKVLVTSADMNIIMNTFVLSLH